MDKNIKETFLVPEEFVDKIAKKITESIGNTGAVKKMRRSQLITVLLGVIGFSLFTFGVSKIFMDSPGPILVILGLICMVVSGISIQNINK